jgi:hypothetical protein
LGLKRKNYARHNFGDLDMSGDYAKPNLSNQLFESPENSEPQKGILSSIVLAPETEIIGRDQNFVIEKLLSDTGMTSVVYLAKDEAEQDVVLKFLRPDSTDLTKSFYRSEAQIISTLRKEGHKCVPKIYETKRDGKYEFVAMEFISSEFQSLEDLLIQKGPLGEGIVLEIARQFLELLHELHTGLTRTYTDMQLKNFLWDTKNHQLMLMDWNHVSYERNVIEDEEGNVSKSPRVVQQLQGRGAENFDDLIRLDLLRFVSYLYRLLTGKISNESGEDAWSLKARAGKRWESVSERTKQILHKGLIHHPSLSPYLRVKELLEDIEEATNIQKVDDYARIRTEIANALDHAESISDEGLDDETRGTWLEAVNRASAWFDRVLTIAKTKSPDEFNKKALQRQQERLKGVNTDVSPEWGRGQNYFEYEQYREALEIWQAEVEQLGSVQHWRQFLLARIAIETDHFDTLKPYLENVLSALKESNIQQAYQDMKSALAGVAASTVSLDMIQAEVESLWEIKQAAITTGDKTIEHLNKAKARLTETQLSYKDFLFRDPAWHSLVKPLCTEEHLKTYSKNIYRLDLVKVLHERISMLTVTFEDAAHDAEKRNEYINLIFKILEDDKELQKLHEILLAQPDNPILFALLPELVDGFLNRDAEGLIAQRPIMRDILFTCLQWGAPSLKQEDHLRGHLKEILAHLYADDLLSAVQKHDWIQAKHLANRIIPLLGNKAKKLSIISKIEANFDQTLAAAKMRLEENDLSAAFQGLRHLRKLDALLGIFVDPSIERANSIQELDKALKKLDKDEKKFDEVIKDFTVRNALLEYLTDFIKKIEENINSPEEQDYEYLIRQLDLQKKEFENRFSDDLDEVEEFKQWSDNLDRYKEVLEEKKMYGDRLKEFKALAVNIGDKISRLKSFVDVNQDISALQVKYDQLSMRDQRKVSGWIAALSSIANEQGSFTARNSELQNGLAQFRTNFSGAYINPQVILENTELEELRKKCNWLLEKEAEWTGKLDFLESFSIQGLNELNGELEKWESLLPFAQILEKGKSPAVVLESKTILIQETKKEKKKFSWQKIGLIAAGIMLVLALSLASIFFGPSKEAITSLFQSSEEAPSEEAPPEEAPPEEAPSEEAPSEEAPSEEAPSEEAPSEEAPSEEVPFETLTPAIASDQLPMIEAGIWETICPYATSSNEGVIESVYFDVPPLKIVPPEGWEFEISQDNSMFVYKSGETEKYPVSIYVDDKLSEGKFSQGKDVRSTVSYQCMAEGSEDFAWIPLQYLFIDPKECGDERCVTLQEDSHKVQIVVNNDLSAANTELDFRVTSGKKVDDPTKIIDIRTWPYAWQPHAVCGKFGKPSCVSLFGSEEWEVLFDIQAHLGLSAVRVVGNRVWWWTNNVNSQLVGNFPEGFITGDPGIVPYTPFPTVIPTP